MKKLFIPITAVLFIFLISNVNYAQRLIHGSVGISAAVNGGETDILLPIWTSNTVYIAPAVGVAYIGGVNTDLSVGLVLHNYINVHSHFAPYIGLRGGVILGMPNTGTSTTDEIAGLSAGGEYFFNKHFSMGVEGQLNFTFSDKLSSRFGNPGGTNINTGSLVFATVYF